MDADICRSSVTGILLLLLARLFVFLLLECDRKLPKKVRSQLKFYSAKDYYNYGTKNESHIHEHVRRPTKEERSKGKETSNTHKQRSSR